MPRRVQNLDVEFADLEALAVAEQMIEVAAVGLQVGRVEDGAEDALHVIDVLANADLRAGLRLDERCAREVVGMRVGLQHPFDSVVRLFGGHQHRLDGARIHLAGIVIVVEHGVDDSGLFRGRIGDEVAHRVCRLVEERSDDWL